MLYVHAHMHEEVEEVEEAADQEATLILGRKDTII